MFLSFVRVKMRNLLFILVSLSIEVTSGFIVASGGSEFLDDAMFSENGLNSEEIKTTIIMNKTGYITSRPSKSKFNLEKLQNTMKEALLHEHENAKESNVDERSFIVIDSKYKVPLLNHIHNMHQQKEYSLKNNYKTFVSNVGSANALSFEEYSEPIKGYMDNTPKYTGNDDVISPTKYYNPGVEKRLSDESKNLKAKIQAANIVMSSRMRHMGMKKYVPIERNDVMGQQYYDKAVQNSIVDEFNHLNKHVQAANTGKRNQYKTNEIKDKIKVLKEVNPYKSANDRREYLELLKPPLVRAEVKSHSDKLVSTNSDDFNNLPNFINKYEYQEANKIHNNYFLRAYSVPPTDFSDTNRITNKVEDSSNNQFNTEEIKAFDIGEDKVTDGLLKNTADGDKKGKVNVFPNNTPCGAGVYLGKSDKHSNVPHSKCNCNQINKGLNHFDNSEKAEISQVPMPISTEAAEEELEEIYNKF